MSQHGYTITIKHYLNTKLKGQKQDDALLDEDILSANEGLRYPLYVRITVRRQVTHIKSLIDINMSEKEFQNSQKFHDETIQKEVNLIREHIVRQRPFEHEKFSLKGVLENFRFENQRIGQLVNHFLLVDLKKSFYELAKSTASKRLRLRSPGLYYTFLTKMGGIPRPKPEDLATSDIKMMINWNEVDIGNLAAWWMDAEGTPIYELYHTYPKEFWSFNNYSSLVFSQGSGNLFTVQDWLNGNFKSAFLRSWQFHPHPKELFLHLEEGFNTLLHRHPELSKIMSEKTLNTLEI